jgi:hypothetical protein
VERPKQWSSVLEDFVRKYDHVVLLAFCRTCCADVFAANGRIDAAEQELVAAIQELTDAGQRSRCVNPAARLAEIRVLQGRFDEADELLVGFEGQPDATRPLSRSGWHAGSPHLRLRSLRGGWRRSDRRVCSPFLSSNSWSMRALPRDDSMRRERQRTLSPRSRHRRAGSASPPRRHLHADV